MRQFNSSIVGHFVRINVLMYAIFSSSTQCVGGTTIVPCCQYLTRAYGFAQNYTLYTCFYFLFIIWLLQLCRGSDIENLKMLECKEYPLDIIFIG